ncbi:ABC transporter substrate-binding protein [Streptantibioticus ferralitis]|uniref:ABC transporter substrate-binding protein n=1 Tax=Streptantibioticus ferralitis TaxID=236510 RepID=A0ABT5Z573_9ACTN|nr:ABC transporter substrate-binding protein [Streptantibioticus ferralitis]MDF2258812.1 ABC transporter substrate-binding protein [Streptantibioticus ferralitis]
MKARRSGLAALVALGLVATAGCGRADRGAGGQGQAAKGGTLHVLSTLDLEHLDPARNYVTSSEDVGRLIYRTLTTYAAAPGKAGGRIVPDLATDTGRPSDGARTWTFTLKPGTKFEDGRPITSDDIKYGVERTFAAELPEGPPYARMWLAGGEKYKGPYKDRRGIASIETPDDRSIVFKLNHPVADFGSAVSLPMFAPVPPDKDTGVRYDSRPCSSGPYKIGEFEPKKRLTLVRNTYWNPATDSVRKGLPDKVVIDLNLDPAVVDQRLIAGTGPDADAVAFEPIGPASVGPVMANPAVRRRLVTGGSINTRYLAVNTAHKPLDDVRVRQAIAYALDKDALRTTRGGPVAGELATTLLPPALPGATPDDPFPSQDGKGDPAKAKALLAEAGHGSGLTLTLDTPATTAGKAQGEAVQASLGRAGITVKINAISTSAFYSTVGNTGQEHELVIDGWTPDWPGASTYLPTVFDGRQITAEGNNNRAQYDAAKVDARFDAIAKMNDPTAAATAYGELAKEIMQDTPVVPFLWDKAAILIGSDVAGAYGHVAYVGRLDLVSLGLRK